MKNIGIILIAGGILALMYTGYTYTFKEKVIDLGPVEVVKEKKHTLVWPPLTGCVLIIGGLVLMLANRKGNILK
jgi:uncharacterized membrane protein YidH (DUF202 family)